MLYEHSSQHSVVRWVLFHIQNWSIFVTATAVYLDKKHDNDLSWFIWRGRIWAEMRNHIWRHTHFLMQLITWDVNAYVFNMVIWIESIVLHRNGVHTPPTWKFRATTAVHFSYILYVNEPWIKFPCVWKLSVKNTCRVKGDTNLYESLPRKNW